MQDEETSESTLKHPLAVRALRRSNVRKKIAQYLCEISPNYSYTAEIAYHVRTTPSNVIGAIRGMEERYKQDESLLTLDIVQEKNCGNNVRLYGITSFGKELIKSVNAKE
jgi:uncharacterized protein